MIGQLLGRRYEILEIIGGGGMALVYKAHDQLLNRKVAIKVLRSQYVHDDEFIQRFQREAQSAASLSHPNVVSIYDVGQEEDIHYIVMEFVDGNTLNELIKEHAPLQVENAIHIATQICDALGHAHANEIIHRDIKPHNILIGTNGRVKVTDFGIARAATSSTITQTGSVVGSVHYFSPEHAQGVITGAKSDLYSLGIVLYQMLTGRLPFIGESPISVALKHVREQVEEPRKVNPLIPQSVENVILKAMRKNPHDRYQSASEMLLDLESCLSPERKNEKKLFFIEEDEEKTIVMPAIRGGMLANSVNGEQVDAEAEDDDEADEPKKKRWVKPLVWLTVWILIFAALYGGFRYAQSWFEVKEEPVPNVINKTVTEAVEELEKVGMYANIHRAPNNMFDKDIVFDQDPIGINVKVGKTIELYVSDGAEMKVMLQYVGKKWKDAQWEMEGLGLQKDVEIVEVFDDAEIGTIIEQQPLVNEEYDPLTTVFKMTVSKGREIKIMPDLIGKTLQEAEQILRDHQLKLATDKTVYQASFEYKKDQIFDQFPYKKGEEVEVGQSIYVTISTGPPAEAATFDFQIKDPLVPAKEGAASTFRIVITDVRNEETEYKTMKVSAERHITVPVTVTPGQNAIIKIYRDNELYETQTVSYRDYEFQRDNPTPPEDDNKPVEPTGSAEPVMKDEDDEQAEEGD